MELAKIYGVFGYWMHLRVQQRDKRIFVSNIFLFQGLVADDGQKFSNFKVYGVRQLSSLSNFKIGENFESLELIKIHSNQFHTLQVKLYPQSQKIPTLPTSIRHQSNDPSIPVFFEFVDAKITINKYLKKKELYTLSNLN